MCRLQKIVVVGTPNGKQALVILCVKGNNRNGVVVTLCLKSTSIRQRTTTDETEQAGTTPGAGPSNGYRLTNAPAQLPW